MSLSSTQIDKNRLHLLDFINLYILNLCCLVLYVSCQKHRKTTTTQHRKVNHTKSSFAASHSSCVCVCVYVMFSLVNISTHTHPLIHSCSHICKNTLLLAIDGHIEKFHRIWFLFSFSFCSFAFTQESKWTRERESVCVSGRMRWE